MPQKHTPHTHEAPQQRTTILWQMLSQALILTAFIIVVLTTLAFIVSRMMLERAIQSQLSSVATIAESVVEETLQAHRERVSLLTNNADILLVLQGREGTRVLERMMADLQREQQSILGIEVYGAAGRLVAGAGDAIGLPEQAGNASFYRPVVTENGWRWYDVFSPVIAADGRRLGYIALRFDAASALSPLLAVVPSLGETAEANLIMRVNDELSIMRPANGDQQSTMTSLGHFDAPGLENLVQLRPLAGIEGVVRGNDYRGRDALIAYRYLPTLGWGLSVQIERRAALEDVRRLAVAHSALGTLLLVLAGALASLLANQLTHPLRVLTDRVRHLRPGAWTIKRSAHTGDEVEILDHVVVDMAGRLKSVYEQQEQIIEDRTKELKKQYALDRAILESVEFGIITVNPKGVITGVNPAAALLLAEKQEEMVGKNAAAIIQVCGHRGNPLKGKHPVLQCLHTRKTQYSPVNSHLSLRRKDEALLPVTYAVSPLIAQGNVFGAILVFQDVTDQRRLDYLKSEFIALASHQLRTPLSSIRWYVELMQEEKKGMTKEQKGYLHEMQTSIVRMVALLNSLLRAARLDGDRMVADLQKTDVGTVLRELEEDTRSLLSEADLRSTLTAPHKRVFVETDPTLLRIVLQNLLTNAIKYTPKGSKDPIAIHMEEAKSSITISVSDKGMGIPKNEQHRVFQKFFRAKNVRKRDTDGNGLGLYITHTIVDRLGGTIKFTSEENKGTTFFITLPKVAKKK